MTKESLREKVQEARRDLEPAWVEACSAAAAGRLIRLDAFQRADTVFCYMSLPHEVGTSLILETCFASGKRVCVPAFDRVASTYAPAWLDTSDALRRGRLGVMEPADVRWIDRDAVDVAVVPGVAFDPAGRRLGHGGGYYDRILARLGHGGRRNVFRVGLSFEFQVFECIPAASHDVCMDAVVTERRVLRRTGDGCG